MEQVGRHTWVNTFVGILDVAFALSEEERYHTQDTITRLLEALRIPERGIPAQLPAAVALEASSGMFSRQLYEPRDAGVVRYPHASNTSPVTLEAWRQALLNLFRDAYPDMHGAEVVVATSVLNDLLMALGLPMRSASYLPEEVVRAHISGA